MAASHPLCCPAQICSLRDPATMIYYILFHSELNCTRYCFSNIMIHLAIAPIPFRCTLGCLSSGISQQAPRTLNPRGSALNLFLATVTGHISEGCLNAVHICFRCKNQWASRALALTFHAFDKRSIMQSHQREFQNMIQNLFVFRQSR